MILPPFKLEEYFAKHEFVTPYQMGSSDIETHTLGELISMADSQCHSLWNNLKLSYTETHGLPLLREEISKLYASQDKNNILVFTGAEEAIYICMKNLLNANDHAVILTPCYQSLKEIPKAAGAKLIEVPLDWKDGNWSLDIEKFKNAITKNTKLIIVNFPHNPTGYQPSYDLFNTIIEIAKNNDAYLFSDEVYRLSEFNSNDCLPHAADCYENAISLGVMSKSFGLPGLRIGWLATQDTSLLHHFAAYKNYTSICNSAPSEILALIALRNKDKILQRNKAIVKNNLDLLNNFFTKYHAIYEWYRPIAGCINFPRLKLDMPIDQFAADLIAQQGVLVLPGTLFDNNNNHFRIGFGRQNLSEALARFENFTKKLCS